MFTLTLPRVYARGAAAPPAARRRRRRSQPAPAAERRAGAAAAPPRGRAPPPAIDDDRDQLAPGARRILDRRGRRALRGDPARPGARARLPVRRRAHGRRRPRAAAQLSPERDPARHQPARPLRPRRARPAEAQSAHPPHPGARASRSPTTRSRRCELRRGRLRAQAGQARAAGRGVPAARGQAHAGACAACWSSRTTRGSARASRQLLGERRRRDHRRRAPPARRSSSCAATTFDCMVHGPQPARPAAATSCSSRWPSRSDVSFPPVIVYTGRSLTRDEEQRLRRYSQLDHHQGRALARAAARRGHAVPAPGRVDAAGRAPADAARRRAIARPRSRAAASSWSRTTCATSSR